MKDQQNKGDHALRQAERAAKRGDLAAAERWTKVATQNQKQWEQFNARGPAFDSVEDEDALREELMRRLTRFSDYCHDVDRWKGECNAYIEAVKRAANAGRPLPPLRPHPAGSAENEEQHCVGILQGPEPDDGR